MTTEQAAEIIRQLSMIRTGVGMILILGIMVIFGKLIMAIAKMK